MKRYSTLIRLVLGAATLSFTIGAASAAQISFQRDPKAVWGSCESSGGYGSYDEHAGVVCVHPGCDGNPKHSCIVDCDAGGNCTGTTPDRTINRALISLLTATHPVAPMPDTGTPGHGGSTADPGSPGDATVPGRADIAGHIGDFGQIGGGIQ